VRPSVRVRFAPAPTGRLHLGGARTALVNALFARSRGGRFVLRIEDTDADRNVPGAAERIEEDLVWLGIVPDESPSRGGPRGPYRQSERAEHHRAAFETLRRAGHVYPCWCGPEARAASGCPAGCAGLPPGERARRLAAGPEPAWRFRLGEGRTVDDLLRGRVPFEDAPAPDPVVLRPDGRATFLFACAVDDAAMGITHVIRGEDHLPNAWKQEQIQRALGQSPPVWVHLPLVLGPDGTPLSKRHGAVAVAELRERGLPPEAVVLALAHLGWTPPHVPPGGDPWPALVRRFRLERLARTQAVYDAGRLEHLAGRWLRAMPAAELAERALRLAAVRERLALEGSAPDWLGEFLAVAVRARASLVAAAELVRELLAVAPAAPEDERQRAVLEAWLAAWPEGGLAGEEAFKRLAERVAAASGARGRELYHPLRRALTGKEAGPALAQIAPLFDRAAADPAGRLEVRSCRERLRAALAGG